MGASPSGCVEFCGGEDAHAVETQRLIEEQEHAAEVLQAKVKQLENEILERAMQHSALQREYDQLSKVKDYIDKKGSKNSPTDGEAVQQKIREMLQEKASLESQTAMYAKACADLESKLTASDNSVTSLQQQINEMKKNTNNTAEVVSQKQRIAELESALARERKQFEEQQATALELEKRRQLRAKNVAVVNGYLTSFALDSNFQTQLKNPRVQSALDLWAGNAKQEGLSPAQIDEIKKDPQVVAIYPRVKAFETACASANIFFPVEYLRAGKPELDTDALLRIFGPDL